MSHPAMTGGPVTFLERTYEEAIALLQEARVYIASQEPEDRARMHMGDRLLLTLETTRLTSMLAQVVAWLLLQRAVSSGEIPRDAAAAPKHRLGGREVCANDQAVYDGRLPARFRDLLLRGHRLYARIGRLDDLVGRDVTAPRP